MDGQTMEMSTLKRSVMARYSVGVVPGRYNVEMPMWSRIKSMAVDMGKVYIWAEVNFEMPVIERRFVVILDGEDVRGIGTWRFIGTAINHLGRFGIQAYHLYEIIGE